MSDPVRKIGKKMKRNAAKKWLKRWENEHGSDATRGWLYGKEVINELLNYDGCEGIWFFKGIADDNSERLVLFPADANGDVLDKNLRSLGAAASEEDELDQPADNGQECPPNCPRIR